MTAGLEVGVVQVVDRPVREEAQVVGDAGHHAAAVAAQQRSVVHRLEVREVFEALLDEVGDAVQDRAAPGGTERCPGWEGIPRRSDREIDLGGTAAGDLTEERAVDRRVIRERRCGTHALATDEVAGVDAHPGHLDRGGVDRHAWSRRSAVSGARPKSFGC